MSTASRSLPGLPNLIRLLIALLIVQVAPIAFSGTALAASCSMPNNPDYGANTGFQYVAQTCLSQGSTTITPTCV